MLGDVRRGMGLGKDGFIERLSERLAEKKRTQVIERAMGFPAVAQISTDVALQVVAALLLQGGADEHAAILYAMEGEVESDLVGRLSRGNTRCDRSRGRCSRRSGS